MSAAAACPYGLFWMLDGRDGIGTVGEAVGAGVGEGSAANGGKLRIIQGWRSLA